VEELDQTTAIAPYEGQRTFREGLIGAARKHSGQELSAQLEEHVEPFTATYPAFRYLSVHSRLLEASRMSEILRGRRKLRPLYST
jgi:hypothetical protein